MLVSHAHRFIYLKTRKTAGTSVEALLEPFCAPPGHKVRHGARELVTSYGIVGFRGLPENAWRAKFRNHMAAVEIRKLIPDEFSAFLRIANVRNPYDKAVSGFHMVSGMSTQEASRLATQEPAALRKLFLDHLAASISPDRDILLIDGRLVVDRVIRFESLLQDLENLNAELKLGLSDIATQLPTYKLTDRASAGPPLSSYLDRDSINEINTQMAWYFDLFGYEMKEAAGI